MCDQMKETIDAIPMIAKVPIVIVPSLVAIYLVWFVTMGVGAHAAQAAEVAKANSAQIDRVIATQAGQMRVLRAMCIAIANGDKAVINQCLGAE